MKALIKNIIIRYYGIVTLIGESTTNLVLFSLGICRYRIVIYMAIAGIVRAIANTMGISKNTLNVFIIIVGLPLIYIDILKGQLYPVFPHLNILISFSVMIPTVIITNTYLTKLVQKITCNEIFTYCLNCKYENPRLVKMCTNCKSTVKNFDNCDIKYEKPKSLLNIIYGEYVAAVYNFGSSRGVYKNSVKLRTTKMFITNINTIFIKYKALDRGWTSKEVIKNIDIKKIIIEKKKHTRFIMPVLSIITSNGTIYDLYYYAAEPASVKLMEIANCLKKQNTNIEIELQTGMG